ncbi:cytidylate kinase family protein [Clostridium sp. D33t1_170424_F3]|uniref:cytidylate kinase family protein n=1 Tax=Clostridium sp. D33t1_170424_F3 TaxID=2787099 RepID=UPI0018AB0E26
MYGELTDKSPEKRLKEKDKKRCVYCKHYTGYDWGVARDYHLTLGNSVIGVERCAEIIVGFVRDN